MPTPDIVIYFNQEQQKNGGGIANHIDNNLVLYCNN